MKEAEIKWLCAAIEHETDQAMDQLESAVLNNGKVENQVPHFRCFGSYFDVIVLICI